MSTVGREAARDARALVTRALTHDHGAIVKDALDCVLRTRAGETMVEWMARCAATHAAQAAITASCIELLAERVDLSPEELLQRFSATLEARWINNDTEEQP